MSTSPSLEEFFESETQLNITIENQNCQYIFYNYIYVDPRKPGRYSYEGLNMSFLYEPFYVGKGKNKRMFCHSEKEKSYKGNKLKNIISKGFNPYEYIIKIKKEIIELESLEYETYLIKTIGRYDLGLGPLTNLTDGGDGACNLSPKFKKVFSEMSKGNNNKQSRYYLINVKGFSEKEANDYLKEKGKKSGLKLKGRKLNLTQEEIYKRSKHCKGKTYEEIYGEEKAKELKKKKSLSLKNKNYEERYGEEKSLEIKEKISKKQKGRIKTKEEIIKTNETKRKNGSGIGSKNPSAKKFKIIDHNNNLEFILHGEIISWCKSKNFNYPLFISFLNKGRITLEMIIKKYEGVRKQNAGKGINSSKKYIGYEILAL